MLQIGSDGIPLDGWGQNPTAVGQCVLKSIYDSNGKKEALFAKPPHADYWMRMAFNPGVSVAAK